MDQTQAAYRIKDLKGFWKREFALYLNEHRHPLNRLTHLVGIPMLVITPILALVWWNPWVAVIGWIVGWAFQLLGHRIEGNRPALMKRKISWVIGPLMVMVHLLEIVGFRFGFAGEARQAIGLSGAMHS